MLEHLLKDIAFIAMSAGSGLIDPLNEALSKLSTFDKPSICLKKRKDKYGEKFEDSSLPKSRDDIKIRSMNGKVRFSPLQEVFNYSF